MNNFWFFKITLRKSSSERVPENITSEFFIKFIQLNTSSSLYVNLPNLITLIIIKKIMRQFKS